MIIYPPVLYNFTAVENIAWILALGISAKVVIYFLAGFGV
jgi:hypothetical protein